MKSLLFHTLLFLFIPFASLAQSQDTTYVSERQLLIDKKKKKVLKETELEVRFTVSEKEVVQKFPERSIHYKILLKKDVSGDHNFALFLEREQSMIFDEEKGQILYKQEGKNKDTIIVYKLGQQEEKIDPLMLLP